MTSSIQKNFRNLTLTVTILRWLWAPTRLISREQGQTVVTGTAIPTTKSILPPSFVPRNRHRYSIRLFAPDLGAVFSIK